MVQSRLLNSQTSFYHFFLDKNDLVNNVYQQDIRQVYLPEQVHSNRVVIIDSGRENLKNTDGLISQNGKLIGVKTADCLPILLADTQSKSYGCLHVGWQGLYAGIIKNAINKLRFLDCNPKQLIVAIGPHIRECCYSVPFARIMLFQKKFVLDNKDCRFRKKKWYLNLSEIAVKELTFEGIKQKNIDILPICTYCCKSYFSYRRDGYLSDRMVNLIKSY